METRTHRRLRATAVRWLLEIGCRAVATEVTCPIGRWRLDAAGWLDDAEEGPLPEPRPLLRSAAPVKVGASGSIDAGPGLFEAMVDPSGEARRGPRRRGGPRRPRTIVIECKQSRADFHRNDSTREALLAERERLRAQARRIEEVRIKRHEPHLRRIEAGLFEEEESWDFSATRIGAYRTVLERLETIERELYGRSKFDLLRRYRLADHCFVLCPRGLLQPREVPEGWGLLEWSRPRTSRPQASRADAAETDRATTTTAARADLAPIRRRLDAPRLETADTRRARLLRNVAVAATRAAWRRWREDAR